MQTGSYARQLHNHWESDNSYAIQSTQNEMYATQVLQKVDAYNRKTSQMPGNGAVSKNLVKPNQTKPNQKSKIR